MLGMGDKGRENRGICNSVNNKKKFLHISRVNRLLEINSSLAKESFLFPFLVLTAYAVFMHRHN